MRLRKPLESFLITPPAMLSPCGTWSGCSGIDSIEGNDRCGKLPLLALASPPNRSNTYLHHEAIVRMKRTTVLFVVIFAVIFLGQELLTIVPELVRHTGMCPGIPPDGTPYPCTSTDLLMRAFSSPFAVAGPR